MNGKARRYNRTSEALTLGRDPADTLWWPRITGGGKRVDTTLHVLALTCCATAQALPAVEGPIAAVSLLAANAPALLASEDDAVARRLVVALGGAHSHGELPLRVTAV